MEKNIYDLIISELILSGTGASGGSTSSAGPRLELTNSRNIVDISVPASGETLTYTSKILNIPDGYTISSHIVTPTSGTQETTTSNTLITSSKVLTIASVGGTFVTTSEATLTKSGSQTYILTAINTITGVAPMYFGLKVGPAYSTNDLTAQASTKNTFELTTGSRRLHIVLPTSLPPLLSVTDPNGLIIPVSSFVTPQVIDNNQKYYVLNWDTELTGTNKKKFTLNFN
jgi:hypothetical protein